MYMLHVREAVDSRVLVCCVCVFPGVYWNAGCHISEFYYRDCLPRSKASNQSMLARQSTVGTVIVGMARCKA